MIFLLLLCPGSVCDEVWQDLAGTYVWQFMCFNFVKLYSTEKVSGSLCRFLLLKKQTFMHIGCSWNSSAEHKDSAVLSLPMDGFLKQSDSLTTRQSMSLSMLSFIILLLIQVVAF